MRSISKDVQNLRGRGAWLPERPWWSWSGAIAGGRLIGHGTIARTDGLTFAGSHTDAVVFAERTDLERPLPHPGWRVGQVWAARDGYALVVTRLDTAGWPVFSGDAWLTDMLLDLVLVADPIRPNAAPWSPTAYTHGNRRSDAE